MKNLKYSLAARIAAVFLFVLTLAAAVGGTIGIVYMANEGYYSDGRSFYDTGVCAGITSGYANTVYYEYLPLSQEENLSAKDQFYLKQYETMFSKENTNFFFTITDANGETVFSNYEEQDYGTQLFYTFEQSDAANGGSPEGAGDQRYTVNCYVKDPITVKDDYYTPYKIFNTLYSMRYMIIAAVVLSAILALLLFIFLLCSAGHKKGKEEIVLNAWDRIPLDLCVFGIFMAALVVLNVSVFYYISDIVRLVLLGVVLIAAALLMLALCMTFAVRVKAGKWWENTVLYRVFSFVFRTLRLAAKTAGIVTGNLPLLWKTVLAFAVYLFVNIVTFILFMDTRGEAVFFVFGLLFNLAVLLGLCFLILQMQALKEGGKRIAGGDYISKIDTKNMFWDIKAHAEALNNIGAGMSRAVEERLKSERFKTELITNVSHDLKTPLTSIMNYVDLLKKETIDSETAREYIEVLDRQSARLKKLTEDLMEASKASTGNIPLNPVRTDLVELVNQSVGEYTERFALEKLEVLVRSPQGEVAVYADGRLLWRVFDNLLNNIVKYSQPGTRVYLDVGKSAGKAAVTLKNISKYPLNITTDELLERFVRGDSARTTEGSGLGLSIAKSLTELQRGSFDLSVDGDLFKVVIRFDSIL